MTKILLSSFVLLCLLSTTDAQTPATAGSGFNYSSFTAEKKIVTPELQSLTDKQFYDHPEFGVLPYNAPCTDCIELLQKRDETHRYFVKNGTHGKEFYQQSSYGSLSYKENGVLRTIDPRIQPTGQKEVFKATHQPFPVSINIPEKFTSILNAGKELQVNRDVNIYIEHKDGSTTSLGEPDWTNYTVGDDGMVIHNFYPGIDLEMQTGTGRIETFYRLNKPLHLTDGWLVIRDNMKVPDGLVYDYSHSIPSSLPPFGGQGGHEGTLFLNNKDGVHYFYIGTPAAYDENNEHDNAINLNYQIADNGVYDLYIPIDWMNDANRSYPLIIDPFVTATSTLPQASITGSGYNATCFQNGCTYQLAVTVPACCVVTGMTYSFNYTATGTCDLDQAAYDLTWGACRSPSAGGTWQTCSIGLPGLCILQNMNCFVDFQPCLTPQCTSYNIPMVLTFYRCVQNIAGCGFSCIMAATPWIMTVTGRTVEIGTPVSSAGNGTICTGGIDTLTANAAWGIPPYSFTWYPGDLTGNPVIVSPDTTTTYTVRVSTCCGTDSDSATVTIVVDSCTGIIESYLSNLFTIYPNPSQGSFTIQSDNVKSDHADMDIYNGMGEKVYSFVIREEDLRKGYQLHLNSSSGLYLLVLRADDAVMGKKISVLK